MDRFVWRDQVTMLNTGLSGLESQATQGGLDARGLEEFKSALDDLRLRAWGLLTAISTEDPHGFQERFRVRRGTEMCRAVTTDLQTGKLSGGQPELPGLGAAAQDLAAVVKQVGRPDAAQPAASKGKPKGKGKRSGNGKTGR